MADRFQTTFLNTEMTQSNNPIEEFVTDQNYSSNWG